MTVADRGAHADRLERVILAEGTANAFAHADRIERPFRHWRFNDALPKALCREIIALPISLPPALDSLGKRSSLNKHRHFFSPETQRSYPAACMIAEVFQSELVIGAIKMLCAIDCTGSYLRIEYCQDRDGFWLEPHMDIREKLVTIQLYLNTGPDAKDLGTDLYNEQEQLISRTPGALGEGLAFVPSERGSWHGFEKRPIKGVRRSLIVNYVTSEWRARHELSFPELPVPPR